jgi:transglutaminase-like putative cysteine protease
MKSSCSCSTAATARSIASQHRFELFGHIKPGWNRVQAICDWVWSKVAFNYQHARPTKTALDVYTERVGVCRDFQHLAITFCRALNIPARYATGYLGDIGVPVVLPMDFSAWFEVWLDDRWWAFDARNNSRALAASSWPPAATPRTSPSPLHSERPT